MHRPLSLVLYAISAIQGIAAVALLFASRWVVSMAFPLLAVDSNGFVLALLKGFGLVVLGFAYLTCCAARDPVRYVAVINALIFLALGAAVLNLYAVIALHVPPSYVSYLLTRTAIQAVLAAILLILRPRVVAAA
jgi:hypothetical protein